MSDELEILAAKAVETGEIPKGLSRGKELALTALMSRTGDIDRMHEVNAVNAMVGFRQVVGRKAGIAAGYADTIEAIQDRILACLAGQVADYTAEDIERLMRAAKLANDSMLSVLGDPTTVHALQITQEPQEAAQNQIAILERLAEKAALRATSIDVSSN